MAPGVIPAIRLQGLSPNANPSRTSLIDPALAQCISLLIADFNGPGNAQVIALGHVTDAHFQFRP
jgi:hypothetical protein